MAERTQVDETALETQRFQTTTRPRFDFQLSLVRHDVPHRQPRFRVRIKTMVVFSHEEFNKPKAVLAEMLASAVALADPRLVKQLTRNPNDARLMNEPQARAVYAVVHLGAMVHFEPFEPVNWAKVLEGSMKSGSMKPIADSYDAAAMAGGLARRVHAGKDMLDALGYAREHMLNKVSGIKK